MFILVFLIILSPCIMCIYNYCIYGVLDEEDNDKKEEIELKLISIKEVPNYNSC